MNHSLGSLINHPQGSLSAHEDHDHFIKTIKREIDSSPRDDLMLKIIDSAFASFLEESLGKSKA